MLKWTERGQSMADISQNLIKTCELLAEFLPLILPIALIQWALMIFALIKLLKAESEPKYISKWIWLIIIILVNIIGPVLYLMIGRNDE